MIRHLDVKFFLLNHTPVKVTVLSEGQVLITKAFFELAIERSCEEYCEQRGKDEDFDTIDEFIGLKTDEQINSLTKYYINLREEATGNLINGLPIPVETESEEEFEILDQDGDSEWKVVYEGSSN